MKLTENKDKIFAVDGIDHLWGRSIKRALEAAGKTVKNAEELGGVDTLVLANRGAENQAERTKELVAAALEADVQYIVYIGLAGMHKRTGDRIANTELAAEEAVRNANIPTLIIRTAPVASIGEGRLSRAENAIKSSTPFMFFPAQGNGKTAPITEEDFGDAASDAIINRREGLISIGGPELLSAYDIQNRISEKLGKSKLMLHVPKFIYNIQALFSMILGKPAAMRDKLDWYFLDMVPDKTTSAKLLGREPKPFDEVYNA